MKYSKREKTPNSFYTNVYGILCAVKSNLNRREPSVTEKESKV